MVNMLGYDYKPLLPILRNIVEFYLWKLTFHLYKFKINISEVMDCLYL